MRGLRPLDREQNSSHVLEVEAYNTEQGPMRSSVRVRSPGLGWGCSRQPPGVLAAAGRNFQPSPSGGRRAGSSRDLAWKC